MRLARVELSDIVEAASSAASSGVLGVIMYERLNKDDDEAKQTGSKIEKVPTHFSLINTLYSKYKNCPA